MIEPSVGLLRMVVAPLKRGVHHMLAWLKLFRKAPENLALVENAKAVAAQWADVDKARANGYPVCACTFPPTIERLTETGDGREWRCPACGGHTPPYVGMVPLYK